MDKISVIASFCMMADNVMNTKFNCSIPADCFCHESEDENEFHYQFDVEIMEFINQAVELKLSGDLEKVKLELERAMSLMDGLIIIELPKWSDAIKEHVSNAKQIIENSL